MDGRVVPLLGAGANLVDRPSGAPWQRGSYLPSAAELAGHLAARFDYPQDDPQELVRISEYAYVMTGSGPLYEQLHEVFDADYAIGPLHRFLAALPARLREAGRARGVPADRDDELRRRARARRSREAGSRSTSSATWPRGSTAASSSTGRRTPTPSSSSGRTSTAGCGPGERTVVLKMHGAVDRTTPRRRGTAT